jgi:hypothetical protein
MKMINFIFVKGFPGRWGEVTRIDLSTPIESLIPSIAINNDAFDPNLVTESTNSIRDRFVKLFRKSDKSAKDHKLLGEWHATAIAGNDISSSCLYTAGICAQKGK